MSMEKGSGYPRLLRNLSLCNGSLSPLKWPAAAHVHIKTVDRIPPGNFFHQHSSRGDSEVALRDSPYTVRGQSWTSINFKEPHRVLHLETKASPKNSFSRHPNCPKDNQQQKKCGLQVALLPSTEVWTFITFNNIYRAKQQQNPVRGGWEGTAEGQPGKHLVGADFI